METEHRRPRWLMSEARRILVATVSIIPVSIAAAGLLILYDVAPGTRIWSTLLAGWLTFALVETLLTWLAYRGLTGATLEQALRRDADRAGRRRTTALMAWVTGGRGAASWGVNLSVMALFAVLGLLVAPGLKASSLVLVLSAVLVVMSWFNVAVNFATQYGRLSVTDGGVEFPGAEELAYSDLLYLALMVQTTFGTTDVQLTRASSRRAVMSQSLIAFMFNTLIIALLVSLLLGAV